MLKAENELFSMQLGLNEEEYMVPLTGDIYSRSENIDENTRVKFLTAYYALSKREKEIIRTLNIESLINMAKENSAPQFIFAIKSIEPEFFKSTIENFVEKLKDN